MSLPPNPVLRISDTALSGPEIHRTFAPLVSNRSNQDIVPLYFNRTGYCIWMKRLESGRLHQISPYVYLVDVLQRVSTHPARDVHLLTPRLWKEHFADKPLKSVLERNLCN